MLPIHPTSAGAPVPIQPTSADTPVPIHPAAAGAPVPVAPTQVTSSPEPPSVAPDTETLWQALREVSDPEFPISLVDLGLIYAIRREAGTVEVDLTFTATACPCMDFIRTDIRERLQQEPGVEEVRINEVWDPPWTPARMTEEGKAALRRVGVAA